MRGTDDQRTAMKDSIMSTQKTRTAKHYQGRFNRTTNNPTNQNNQTIMGKKRHLVIITLNANGINLSRKRCYVVDWIRQ